MKLGTQVYARFESKGRPSDTRDCQGTLSHVTMQMARWLQEIYMGSHIRVTMARSELELNDHCGRGKASESAEEFKADLEALLTGALAEEAEGAES